ncbi:GGDEF domain-containing protein [Methylocapsa sp. S129]|uniref:GGDEF domain-containing protein n=1 Tax=Methylocapsa sp. S129 TaxID=1641869 RepID=UPI00131C160D|nr:GGDEF domain-containing protein [Methylocapsa sp. S129]
MRFFKTPWLQLAIVILIALLGMVGAIDNIQNPYALACILGLMALGFIGMGLGELRGAGASAHSSDGANLKDDFEARRAQLDRELDTIANLIQSHLDANGRYSDSLAQADQGLLPSTNPEKVRAIVRLLIDANEKMRRETGELSTSLEKSRSQVAALRSKLVEAQAIGMRDSLTSLSNRRAFDSNLTKEIAQARAQGTEMCLMMGDLDHFKKVNDNYGHPFGDRVLKYFAELLLKHIKDGDIAARLGGEEFAVILPQTTLESATRLTDQIRGRLEAQQWMNAQSGQLFSKITASFGIVRLSEKDDSETLVKRADTMLYEAKRTGRNRIIIEDTA